MCARARVRPFARLRASECATRPGGGARACGLVGACVRPCAPVSVPACARVRVYSVMTVNPTLLLSSCERVCAGLCACVRTRFLCVFVCGSSRVSARVR